MQSLLHVRCIRSAFLSLGLLTLASSGIAQVPERSAAQDPNAASKPSQAELKEWRSKKLAQPVFKNAAWRTDFDAAKAEAKKGHKLILAYFTRSYAP